MDRIRADPNPCDQLERIRPELIRLSATFGDRLIPPLRALVSDLARFVANCSQLRMDVGPMAPSRKRPRRLAKKIAARGGRLRYPRWS